MAESLKQEVNLSKRACWRNKTSNNCNEKSTGAINNFNQNKCENNFSQFFNNQIIKCVNNCLFSSIKILKNGDTKNKKYNKLNVSYSFNKIPVVLVLLGVLFYSSGLATARPNFSTLSGSDVSIFFLNFSNLVNLESVQGGIKSSYPVCR